MLKSSNDAAYTEMNESKNVIGKSILKCNSLGVMKLQTRKEIKSTFNRYTLLLKVAAKTTAFIRNKTAKGNLPSLNLIRGI
ncbi:MAG TPA: hypothetical protein VHP38_15015 [Ruminiclostridium sp.]|nr:hypothetical protein [Ruminiclostridium sp.]